MKTFAEYRSFLATAPDSTRFVNVMTGNEATLGAVLFPYNASNTPEALTEALDYLATLMTEGRFFAVETA